MTIHKRINVEFACPYATRNLVAWYDGEWNAGPGRHGETGLADLSGNGQDMFVQSGSIEIGANYFRATTSDACLYAVPCRALSRCDCMTNTLTAEFAVGPDYAVNATVFGMTPNDKYTTAIGLRFNSQQTANDVMASAGNSQFRVANLHSPREHGVSIAFTRKPLADGVIPVAFYENGVLAATAERTAGNYNTITQIGLLNCSGMNAFMGKIHSFRLYLGTHTAGEIASNAAVDAERFFSR